MNMKKINFKKLAIYIAVPLVLGAIVGIITSGQSSNYGGHTKANVITYGIKNKAMFMAKNIRFNDDGYASFDVYFGDELLGDISLSVPGEHNVSNALAAISLSYMYGISFDDIKSGLKKYSGAAYLVYLELLYLLF